MEKNPDIQFCSPEEIKLYQEARLTETLAYLQAHSRFYQQMFKEHSIDTTRIKKIEDLQQIPVTTKTDLQLHNSEFICVDPDDIIDYVTTSGTLGDPVTFVLTSKDLAAASAVRTASCRLSMDFCFWDRENPGNHSKEYILLTTIPL